MKKKVLIILVAAIAVFSVVFAVSSSNKNKEQDEGGKVVSINPEIPGTTKAPDKEVIVPTEYSEESDEKWSGVEEHKDPDKIVTVKIPLSFIDEKYANNLSAYARANGYESATLNPDRKTVTVKMKALSYELMRINIGVKTIQAICETIESETYPYVINMGDYDRDFSYMSLIVDEKKFKKADNIDGLFDYVSICCAYYMLNDPSSGNKLKIDIFSEKTGELLATKNFKKNDVMG